MSANDMVEMPNTRFAPWLVEPMLRNSSTYFKVALAAVFINVFGLVTALFTLTVYDRVVPNSAVSSLVGLSIGFGVIIIFDFILKMLRAYFVDYAGAQIDRDVGETVFSQLLAIRLDLKKGTTGGLAGMLRELEGLRDFFASATIAAIVDVPFILLTLAVIAMIGGPVVYVPLLLVPIVILVGWSTHPALDRLSARSMSKGLLKQSVLVETIGGLETVKTSGASALLAGRWRQAVDHHADISLRQRLISSIGTTFATSAGTISYAGIVIVGVGLIINNELTMGALMASSILGGRAIAPLAQIAQLLSRLTITRTAYRQINSLMQLAPEGPAGVALQLKDAKGHIEFRKVSFRYPGAAEKTLDGISFSISPGEKVALLGKVGSGKSTIARLALGLYPPEEGIVMIDGTDMRQFEPNSLRRHMGATLQESVLLTGSVRENIGLGRENVDEEELLRVALISGTHDFIGNIANGYDLILQDRGEGLSGGQRQSISLARALATRPKMLVMDEPSSAMDAETEALLIERLKAELTDRTFMIITHRPPLLQLVDRIILVDKGKISADGPREQILEALMKPKAT